MPAAHDTKRKAIETLMQYIECHNACLCDANLISPCDYKIETVDLKVIEIIPDFEAARKRLSNTNNAFTINNICTFCNFYLHFFYIFDKINVFTKSEVKICQILKVLKSVCVQVLIKQTLIH